MDGVKGNWPAAGKGWEAGSVWAVLNAAVEITACWHRHRLENRERRVVPAVPRPRTNIVATGGLGTSSGRGINPRV